MEESFKEVAQNGTHREVSETQAAEQFTRLLNSEHWLRSYLTDLLAAHAIGNGLDFHTAELLLKQEKESFEADLALARRMYKMYPQLFRQENETVKVGV